MQSAIFDGNGHFNIIDVPTPLIGSDDVLVRMSTCGVCGTDVHKVVSCSVPRGSVLGHEVSGTVVEVGSNVDKVQVGDRVALAHHVPCFDCQYCRRGQHSLCPHYSKTNLIPGGFSEYFVASGEHVNHTLRKLPNDMPFSVASFMEPLACVIQGQRRANVSPGDTVLILGAGPIGVLHTQLAVVNGASAIYVSDPVEWRRVTAVRLGASTSFNPVEQNVVDEVISSTNGIGVDIAIICAELPSLIQVAMKAVRRGGIVLVFTDIREPIEFSAERFFRDEITVVGSYSSSPYDYDYALQLLYKGQIDINGMFPKVYDLNEINEAMDMAKHPAEGVLKVMVVSDESDIIHEVRK